MQHITVQITGAHWEGAHMTRISFTILMRRLAAVNGAAHFRNTFLIKISNVPKVIVSSIQHSCIMRTSGRAVQIRYAPTRASFYILLSNTARKVAQKS
jgi:hypothetical protein